MYYKKRNEANHEKTKNNRASDFYCGNRIGWSFIWTSGGKFIFILQGIDKTAAIAAGLAVSCNVGNFVRINGNFCFYYLYFECERKMSSFYHLWNAALCKFHVEHCIFQIQNVKTFCCSNSVFAGVNYCNDYYIPQNSSVSRLSEYPVFAVDIICFVS